MRFGAIQVHPSERLRKRRIVAFHICDGEISFACTRNKTRAFLRGSKIELEMDAVFRSNMGLTRFALKVTESRMLRQKHRVGAVYPHWVQGTWLLEDLK